MADKTDGRRSEEWVYWLGCAAAFDPRVASIAKATAKVLGAAGIEVRYLGSEEACSGDAVRRLGEEGLFQQLALQNIETLERNRAERVVTHCAHCFHVFKNEYPRFGAKFEVSHHVELIGKLLTEGRIRVRKDTAVAATLHDSCYVGRYNGVFDAPRAILSAIYGESLVEMPRSGPGSFCCGGGGANYWYDAPKNETAATLRMREAVQTDAQVVAAECPFCVKMLALGAQTIPAAENVKIKDIAEIVAEALEEEPAESSKPVGEKV